MMHPLNLVPLKARDYWYCCAFPIIPVQAWSASLRQRGESAALLEYDLEGRITESASWRSGSEQRWPGDTLGNAQLARARGLRVSGGIPLASAAALIAPVGHEIHYITLGFSSRGATLSVAEWSQVRNVIARSLLPERWPGGARCDAVLHVNEAEFAYLLSPKEELVVDWIGDLVSNRHRELASMAPVTRAARRELGHWVLNEAEGAGVRLDAAEVIRSAESTTALSLRGTWGRDPHVPLTVGVSGGEPFHRLLSLAW